MYDWLHNLVLPLYDQPDGKPQGWIACGWLLSIDGAELTQHSLQAYTLQTGYETYSFLVLDHVNGWLKIRYSTAGPIGGGAAWVPEDQLDLGPVDLTYIPWEERFRPTAQDLARFPGDGYYFFRHPQQPHGLRTAPAATASEILSIRGDHGLDAGASVSAIQFLQSRMAGTAPRRLGTLEKRNSGQPDLFLSARMLKTGEICQNRCSAFVRGSWCMILTVASSILWKARQIGQ